MGEVLLLALLAALNPTLLAATTVMLLLSRPERLMLGYWLGAMFVSVTLGLIIVFTLEGSSVVSTTKTTLSPIGNFVLAAVLLILAAVLGSERNEGDQHPRRRRRSKRHENREPPKWQQRLSRGSAKTTFLIGALLSLPGATYLAGLNRIARLHYASALTVLVVVGFNVVQLLLIEIPIVALKVAPTQTPIVIERAKESAREHGRQYAAWGLVVLAAALAIKGIIEATS